MIDAADLIDEAVEQAGALLARHFPATAANTDELPDAPLVL